MGNLLGAPVTEKETHVGKTDDGVEYGISSMQGWRVHMEDAHIAEEKLYAAEVADDNKYNIIELPGHSCFAVFDGHGGTFAALYSGRNFCRVLSRQKKFVEYAKFENERPSREKTISEPELAPFHQSGLKLLQEALCDAFVELDKEIACALRGSKVADADRDYSELYHEHKKGQTMNGKSNVENKNSSSNNPGESATEESGTERTAMLEDEGDSGTTACVVLLTPGYIVCANAGDSRSVISQYGSKAIPLSYDHKPDDEGEERRIRAAGGYVAGGRVEGDLAVSRGLGDFRFKNIPVVMSVPFSGIQHDCSSEEVTPKPSIKPGQQKVSPIPDIIVQKRNASHDEFIIIACDGIWDVQTNYEAVKTVAEMFEEGETNLGLICEEVCLPVMCPRIGKCFSKRLDTHLAFSSSVI
jgi:serine/threonine protein phosphatase PrpC